jgi:FkbM family methyltransferase
MQLDPAGFNTLCMCRWGPMIYNQHDSYVGRSLGKYGEFSWLEQALFQRIVTPGATVVDAGANIGAHTVPLAKHVGSKGSVHAFEPQRLVFQALCANLALNQTENVYAYREGLGAREGLERVPDPNPRVPNNFGGVSMHEVDAVEQVRVRTLDSLALPACHLIKADVEGMETDVLRGASATIAAHRPAIYVENDREENSAELIALIAGMRYDLYWHTPPLFNPDNFARDSEDVFNGVVSVNLLCVPTEAEREVVGLRRVGSPADRWNAPS